MMTNTTSDRAFQLSLSGHRAPVGYDRAPTYAGMITEKDVLVPMRDGVKIAATFTFRKRRKSSRPYSPARFTTRTCRVPSWPRPRSTHPAWSMLWTGPPGEINEYAIEIMATAIQFKRGHRICVEITSLDVATGVGSATNVEYIPYHICSSKTVLHRIYHDPAHPSHLLLPVIPEA